MRDIPTTEPLRRGQRISLRLRDGQGLRDLLGFVVDVMPLIVEDRHGQRHRIGTSEVVALRRVDVARGRDPDRTPVDLLDDLAARAGLSGPYRVLRISDLLVGHTAPESVFAERGSWVEGGLRARVEGEWVTTNVRDPQLLLEVAWWAAWQGARSLQQAATPVQRSAGLTMVTGGPSQR